MFSVVGFARPGEIFHNRSVCELVYMRAFYPTIVAVVSTWIGLFTLSPCYDRNGTPVGLLRDIPEPIAY